MIHDKPVLHHHMARELCENSEQVPMASAPVIVNRISTSCGNILPPKARIRPTAIVAPTMAVNGTLKGRGKAWAKYPSTGAVTADTITLKINAIAAPSPNSQWNPPRATTSLSVAPKSPNIGPNNRKTALHRQGSNGWRPPPTSERRMPNTRRLPSPAPRHRLRGLHIPSSRAGRFNRMPLPVATIVRQQRAQAHRQQQEEACAECCIHDLWRHCR
jgi:hypothetical protein